MGGALSLATPAAKAKARRVAAGVDHVIKDIRYPRLAMVHDGHNLPAVPSRWCLCTCGKRFTGPTDDAMGVAYAAHINDVRAARRRAASYSVERIPACDEDDIALTA